MKEEKQGVSSCESNREYGNEVENEALIQLRNYLFVCVCVWGGVFLLLYLFKTIYNEEWKKES